MNLNKEFSVNDAAHSARLEPVNKPPHRGIKVQ